MDEELRRALLRTRGNKCDCAFIVVKDIVKKIIVCKPGVFIRPAEAKKAALDLKGRSYLGQCEIINAEVIFSFDLPFRVNLKSLKDFIIEQTKLRLAPRIKKPGETDDEMGKPEVTDEELAQPEVKEEELAKLEEELANLVPEMDRLLPAIKATANAHPQIADKLNSAVLKFQGMVQAKNVHGAGDLLRKLVERLKQISDLEKKGKE
jgi:hypothetical protein